MKKSTLFWIGGILSLFFVVILVLMYLTLQPSEEFASVENVFEEYMFPGQLKKHLSVQLGPISLFLLRKTIRTTSLLRDMEYNPSLLLENISKGEIGIYQVKGQDNIYNPGISQKLSEKMTQDGWKRFLTVRDDGTNAEGFLKSSENLDGLFIYVLDGNDLVIINIGTNNS